LRDQPVELLTLSACETAAGDDRAALGLAGVAIKAGARSALATLWFVNDQASTSLVSSFYSHLKKEPNTSKAMALRAAQMELIGQPPYAHPCYWAPYLIIGNWL
jgi:CHAT domain-containing protein